MAMAFAPADTIRYIKSSFEPRAFIIGLGVVGFLYVLLSLYILFAGPAYMTARENSLASRTIVPEYIGTPKTPEHQTESAEATTEQTAEDTPRLPKKRPLPNPFEARGLQVLESGLAQAPIEAVADITDDGILPKIDTKTKLTPFQAYKRPFTYPQADEPMITVAIEDMGLSDAATESAVRTMPAEVSLILSPYATNPDFWMNVARERGHEIWMHLPLETEKYPEEDPGPNTIMVDAPERDNLRKLHWLMSRTQGYVGFVTGPDNVFIKSLHDMRPIIGDIYNRGLGLIDASAKPSAIPATMAAGQESPYGTVQLYIGENDNMADIRKQRQSNGYHTPLSGQLSDHP